MPQFLEEVKGIPAYLNRNFSQNTLFSNFQGTQCFSLLQDRRMVCFHID